MRYRELIKLESSSACGVAVQGVDLGCFAHGRLFVEKSINVFSVAKPLLDVEVCGTLHDVVIGLGRKAAGHDFPEEESTNADNGAQIRLDIRVCHKNIERNVAHGVTGNGDLCYHLKRRKIFIGAGTQVCRCVVGGVLCLVCAGKIGVEDNVAAASFFNRPVDHTVAGTVAAMEVDNGGSGIGFIDILWNEHEPGLVSAALAYEVDTIDVHIAPTRSNAPAENRENEHESEDDRKGKSGFF